MHNENQNNPDQNERELQYPIAQVAKVAADDLRHKILSGEYAHGTRLPSERKLAEAYDIGRAHLRQALDYLERAELITRRRGSGSIVIFELPAVQEIDETRLRSSELGKITSPLEFGVARSVIEPEIARLAVINMIGDDIEKMNTLMANVEAIITDAKEFATATDALRLHLAQCSRNPLMLEFWRIIDQVNNTADWALRRRYSFTPAKIRDQTARLRALTNAIENRQSGEAVERIKLIIAELNQDLISGGD